MANQEPVSRSQPVPIKIPHAITEASHSNKASPNSSNSDERPEGSLAPAASFSDAQLRKWCSGQVPKKSYLGSDSNSPPRFPLTHQPPLAGKPELDALLEATKVEYHGHFYLPLTVQTIHRLSSFWKGTKPIAHMEIFDCIMLNYEINNAHADHVVNALERIGTRCKRLLVIAPIHTSELGNVFNREMGNIDPGNDWNHILRCFPNLKCLILVHPLNEPEEISRATYLALRSAITRRQATHDINGFGYVGAPRVLTCFAHNTTNSTTSTITITRL